MVYSSHMSEPHVVIIGHVCIDHNTTEHASYTSWGSSALYIAQYIRQAYNNNPLVVSNYGPDLVPYIPEITMLPAMPSRPQTLLYENNTQVIPRIWKAHNTTFADAPQITPLLQQALAQADIVIIATLLPNYSPAYIQELLGYTSGQALKLLCPQGYFRSVDDAGLVSPRNFKEASEIIPLFDIVVYSEEDTPKAFALAAEWSRAHSQTRLIVTEGSKGASIITASSTEHIPTKPLLPEEIIDSVGCGDTFAATVAYEYWLSNDLPEAIRTAHQAAARKLRSTPVS